MAGENQRITKLLVKEKTRYHALSIYLAFSFAHCLRDANCICSAVIVQGRKLSQSSLPSIVVLQFFYQLDLLVVWW